MKKVIQYISSRNRELLFWIVALSVLAWIRPTVDQDFTLCIFSQLGWENCWGCGLGRSIAFLFEGDIQTSWEMHWLGIPALLIIIGRIGNLLLLPVINITEDTYK